MSKYVPIKYPGARYGPGGAVGIFQSEEEVPKGWTDNPNDFAPEDAGGLTEINELRARYVALAGKKGGPRWDEATYREKIAELEDL